MEHSIWSAYLKNEQDDFALFKNIIQHELDSTISKVTSMLLNSEYAYSNEIAKKVAVNLVMEQLLCTQHELSPDAQRAMIINLFMDHPDIAEFRHELCETLKSYK